MEYQLELANKTIEELKQKLLAAEQQIVSQETDKISKIELQEKQIERMSDEIAQLYRKLESQEHELRIKDDQYYKCGAYIERLEQQLREAYYQIDDQNDYLKQIEQRIDPLNLENINLIKQNKSLQQELEYYKRSVQSQINKMKAEYEMKIIEQQDKLIQMTRTPNKENIAISQNTSFIDYGKESRASRQSNQDQLFELQSELNKNIKLLNSKLKQYK
ncbi:unnamed protein product [Paramecium primaurelia]|uniref:Uncharacterized protein n=1 Tax=Paramecium primaurelia TaxID=5886 RepID=A0A8S1LSK7_PARPR|nr:unnamed protein product [Paramecium primaurelia]